MNSAAVKLNKKDRSGQSNQFLKVSNNYLRYATQLTDENGETLRLTALTALLTHYFSFKEFSVPTMAPTDIYKYGGWRTFVHKHHIKEGFYCFDEIWAKLVNTGYVTRHKVPTGGKDKFMHDYYITEKKSNHKTLNLDKSTLNTCYKQGFSYKYKEKWVFIEDGKKIPEKFKSCPKSRSYPLRKDVVQRATLPTEDFTMVNLSVLLSKELTLEEKAMFVFIQRQLDIEAGGTLDKPLTKTMVFASIKDCTNAKEMAWRGLLRKGYLHADPIYKRGRRGIYCYSYSLTAPPQITRASITYIEEADSEMLFVKENKQIKIPEKPLSENDIERVNYRKAEYSAFDSTRDKLKIQLQYDKMIDCIPYMGETVLTRTDVDYTLELLAEYMVDSNYPIKPAKERVQVVMAYKNLVSGEFLAVLERCFKRIRINDGENEPIRSINAYLLCSLYSDQKSAVNVKEEPTSLDLEQYSEIVKKFVPVYEKKNDKEN